MPVSWQMRFGYLLWSSVLFSLIISSGSRLHMPVSVLMWRSGVERICWLVRKILNRNYPWVECSVWSSTGLCTCAFSVILNAAAGKSLFTLNTTIRQPLSSLKRNLPISYYGGSAQAGFVACLCFCGHLARTEIAMLRPWRRVVFQVYIWCCRNKFKVINFANKTFFQNSYSLEWLKGKTKNHFTTLRYDFLEP